MSRVKARTPPKRQQRKHPSARDRVGLANPEGMEYPDAHSEYVYSPEFPSLELLSEKWKPYPGNSISVLLERSAREGWVKERNEFHRRVREDAYAQVQQRMASEMAEGVLDANKRHVQLGRTLQGIGAKHFKMEGEGRDAIGYIFDPKLKAQIPVKTTDQVVRMIKDGTEIERRALGLADQIVKVQFARDVARKVIDVLSKYVTDETVFGNIARDIEALVAGEEEALDEMALGTWNVVKDDPSRAGATLKKN